MNDFFQPLKDATEAYRVGMKMHTEVLEKIQDLASEGITWFDQEDIKKNFEKIYELATKALGD